MLQEGSKVPDLSLLDTEGARVDLASLISDGPAVLFFLRHYA